MKPKEHGGLPTSQGNLPLNLIIRNNIHLLLKSCMAAVGRLLKGDGSALLYKKKTGQYMLMRRRVGGLQLLLKWIKHYNVFIKGT